MESRGERQLRGKGAPAMFKSAAFAILLVLVALPGINLAWRALVSWLVDDDHRDAITRGTSPAHKLASD